jgi:hypothetical protein
MMEHPLIHNVESLEDRDISEKISELNKKLSMARKLGNSYLVGQIVMALESYQQVHARRIQKLTNQDKPELERLSKKIDIS